MHFHIYELMLGYEYSPVWKRITDLILKAFHPRNLRRILQIKWSDRRTNNEVLTIAGTTFCGTAVCASFGPVSRKFRKFPGFFLLSRIPLFLENGRVFSHQSPQIFCLENILKYHLFITSGLHFFKDGAY